MPSASSSQPEVERRFGPFGPAAIRPNAVTRRAIDGSAWLKVYVGIAPEGRRQREVDTVERAPRLGISVAEVLATDQETAGPWAVFRNVPGIPCSVSTNGAIERYMGHVIDLTERLQGLCVGATPGSGWTRGPADPASQRGFLQTQLSERCHRQPWWKVLAGALRTFDSQPVVYLHGDIKPEHLLVDPTGLYVVDWEASARGPAAVDHADAVFHLVRDLVYAGVRPGRVPVDLIPMFPNIGPALAWRVALWVDRRRPSDINLLSAHDIGRLATEELPTVTYRSLARTIARLRGAGVPR